MKGTQAQWDGWDKARRAGKVWEKAMVRVIQERRWKEEGTGKGKECGPVRMKEGKQWYEFPWAMVGKEVVGAEKRVAVWLAEWEKAAGVEARWADTWYRKEREKDKEKGKGKGEAPEEGDFGLDLEVMAKAKGVGVIWVETKRVVNGEVGTARAKAKGAVERMERLMGKARYENGSRERFTGRGGWETKPWGVGYVLVEGGGNGKKAAWRWRWGFRKWGGEDWRGRKRADGRGEDEMVRLMDPRWKGRPDKGGREAAVERQREKRQAAAKKKKEKGKAVKKTVRK